MPIRRTDLFTFSLKFSVLKHKQCRHLKSRSSFRKFDSLIYQNFSLSTSASLSDLMQSTTFELNSEDVEDFDEDSDGMFWNEETQDIDAYKNPCGTSFVDWKSGMIEISEGVFKKVRQAPADDAKQIKLQRARVTYHRNLYVENEDQPFDSTYLNGKSDEICLALKTGTYLEGILEALESMKEGEQSLFIISYMKMFRELGCAPRVSFYKILNHSSLNLFPNYRSKLRPIFFVKSKS